MTTIVITETRAAVDGRITDGNHIVSDNHPKWKFSGFNIRFWSGDVNLENLVTRSNIQDIEPELLRANKDIIIEVVREPNNKRNQRGEPTYVVKGVYEYYKNSETGKIHKMLITDFPYSIGSGKCFAKGAILSGKSATEAICISSQCDCKTGGLITEFNLQSEDYIQTNC